MKTKLHTALLYPLVLIFSPFLKGKKEKYKTFFTEDKQQFQKKDVLRTSSKEGSFYENIPSFFDKTSPLYDSVFVTFELDLSTAPEEKKYFAFDFFRILNIFYALSMLSSRIPNNNINIALHFEKQRLDEIQINHLLRYILLSYASKKVDKLYLDKKLLKNEKSLQAYETMISYLEDSTIIKYSNAKNLYVITCKKGKKSFDIVWSSAKPIELTEFGKVYDKYGELLTKDIAVSNSPIYAFHK